MRDVKGYIRFFASRMRLAWQLVRGKARPLVRPVIETTDLDNGRLVFVGHVLSNIDLGSGALTIRKFREERISQDFPMNLTLMPTTGLRDRISAMIGMRRYGFKVTTEFPWCDLPSSIFGVAISIDGTPRALIARQTALNLLTDDNAPRTLCIFIDPSVRVLRIEAYNLGSRDIEHLRELAHKPKQRALHCIIGEYTNTARDNGRALFEYMRDNAPDINATYVIEPDNLDAYPVGQNGVAVFGSLTHLEACIDASICAFTHHRGYVYPYIIKVLRSSRYKSVRTIFLQHGITAMKKDVVRHYHRARVNYVAICVCSQAERLIFRQHFGYALIQVFATGFPRYDSLFHIGQSVETNPKQVLFFPTWRQGIEKMTSEEVRKGRFFTEWCAAMDAIGSGLGLRRVLVLHPMLHRHAALFRPHVDEIIQPTGFQKALAQSGCLITDYSSVSFDALFLKKPVFLFQFDQDEFGLREDAFIDLETQLPGHVCLTHSDLTRGITASMTKGWPFDLTEQRQLYFDTCDAQNCERVVSLIRTLALTN